MTTRLLPMLWQQQRRKNKAQTDQEKASLTYKQNPAATAQRSPLARALHRSKKSECDTNNSGFSVAGQRPFVLDSHGSNTSLFRDNLIAYNLITDELRSVKSHFSLTRGGARS